MPGLEAQNILTAEALEPTLTLVKAQGTAAQKAADEIDTRIQSAATGAASQAAAGVTVQINTATAAAEQAGSVALAAATVTGTVDTVGALPANAPDGTRRLVRDTGLTYESQGGVWSERVDLSLAAGGQPLGSVLYTTALQDIVMRASGLSLRGLERSLRERRPYVLVIVGDSISEGADLSRYEDSYAYRLEQTLRAVLPYGVTVHNRALGSRNMEVFMDPAYKAVASEPANWRDGFARSWSTPGKSWYEHVRDLAPDDILLAHAMNSGDNYGRASAVEALIRQFYTELDTWASKPGLVLLSTFEPSLRPDTVAANPYIIRNNARMVRSLAAELHVVHADAHRLNRVLRDGVDDVLTRTRTEFNWERFGTTLWQGDARWTVGPEGAGYKAQIPQGVRGQSLYYTRSTRDFSLFTNIGWRSDQENALLSGRTVAGADATIILMVTPNNHPVVGGAGQQGRLALVHRPTGTVIAQVRGNIPAANWTAVTWTAIGPRHTATLQTFGGDGAQVGATLTLVGTHHGSQQDGWIGMGGQAEYDNPVYYNAMLYPMLPIGLMGDGSPARRLTAEAQIMGTWPIEYPRRDGNGMNHPNGTGQALMYYASLAGYLRAVGEHVTLARYGGNATTETAALTMQNGWAAFGAGYATPRVTKRSGQLSVSGLIRVPSGAAYPATVAQLPAGFRPTTTEFLTMRGNGNSSGPLSVVWAQAEPNGNLVLLAGPPYANGEQFVDLKTIMEVY